MSTLCILDVVSSLGLVVLSIPLVLGKIPPNGLYALTEISVDAYMLSCLAVFVLVFGTGLWQSFRDLRVLTRDSS